MKNKQNDYLELISAILNSTSFTDNDAQPSDFEDVSFLDNYYIRIKSIEFNNFRNVEYGKVVFPNCKNEDIHNGNASILGLYGQNGSGKSSVIMAISMLKELLSGMPLGVKYESCIKEGCDRCSLTFEILFTSIESESEIVFPVVPYTIEAFYSFDITRSINSNQDGTSKTKLRVENEVISTKLFGSNGKVLSPKKVLIDASTTESDEKGRPFGNRKKYKEIVGNNKKIENALIQMKGISSENSTSFIFSDKTLATLALGDIPSPKEMMAMTKNYFSKLKTVLEAGPEGWVDAFLTGDVAFYDNLSEEQVEPIDNAFVEFESAYNEMNNRFERFLFLNILNVLSDYGRRLLYVVDTTSTGQINVNEQWYILLWKLEKEGTIFAYRVPLCLDKASSVSVEHYPRVISSLHEVSIVLGALVPGLSLKVNELGKRMSSDGTTTFCDFEVMSEREGKVIPLRYESDGVRRLVSILSLLIAAYNTAAFTIAIDELDAGIFEYLLGEILKVLSEGAKGQIIFTSHNLRPLEVLPPKYLCFTTNNPQKKFIRLQNRGNSNFRDGYYRNIILGTSEEAIYNPTDPYKIEMAFYEARQERGDDNE